MPSFLIDQGFDEVSQTGIAVLLYLVPVLLYLVPVPYPYWANRVPSHGQNSVKQCQTVSDSASPLQQMSELHQKDLRINPLYLHILGPGSEGYLRADTFLALFLVVGFSVPRPS